MPFIGLNAIEATPPALYGRGLKLAPVLKLQLPKRIGVSHRVEAWSTGLICRERGLKEHVLVQIRAWIRCSRCDYVQVWKRSRRAAFTHARLWRSADHLHAEVMESLGFRSFALWISFLIGFVKASYSEDQCSWRGSGLSQALKNVEQVWLRCAEGSVEWLYPAGALRLTLSPRLPWSAMTPSESNRNAPLSACVKPDPHWGGAQLYLERDGVLELLVGDDGASESSRVRCFSALPGERATLFLQATPHQDISRRIATFRYELRGDWKAQTSINSDPISSEGACRPCNNTEILMAVCTSDFVVRGNIRSVESDPSLKAAVIKVSATRVYRQKFSLFPESSSGLRRFGEIRTPLQCGVRPGAGSFLFTGRVHFGEAWLGCAPRYKDFLKAYEQAKQSLMIPCTLLND
ncbi:hypothetical protein DNTS_005721 [Danionella cerebrum]|uniref:Meteorin-like protein n=1 Tax=Danionella cerebrum TaxID=2873325 RepID=A0A553QSF6_9TELE|nr:hypothetical protein DNTS_005721 [Danionella translucida]TRY92909.1 hypothetical protein DNTS_005721 [Danionella translucida]